MRQKKQPAARAHRRAAAYRERVKSDAPAPGLRQNARRHREERAITREEEGQAIRREERRKEKVTSGVIERGKEKARMALEARRERKQKSREDSKKELGVRKDWRRGGRGLEQA